MRIAVLVLAILGALVAGAFGMTWMDDASKSRKSLAKNAKMFGMLSKSSPTRAKIERLKVRVAKREKASYMLFLTLVLALVGGVFAFRKQGKVAAGILAAGLIAPAIFLPASLAVNFLLVLALAMSFFIKTDTSQQSVPTPA